MTFETFGVSSVEDAADKIADRMIAIDGGHWSDGDPAIDPEFENPGRVLKYTNGAEELFLGMFWGAWGDKDNYNSVGGMLIFISSGWNLVDHVPSGSIWLNNISLTQKYNADVYMHPQEGQLWMYWDDNTIASIYRNSPSSYTDNVSLWVMERDTVKEYEDGYSNFYFFSDCCQNNVYGTCNENNGSHSYYRRGYHKNLVGNLGSLYGGFACDDTIWQSKYCHPFGVQYGNNGTNRNVWEGNDPNPDYQRVLTGWTARKSQGNGKIYILFPWAFNDATWNKRTPIKKFNSFFPVKPTAGLIDGDIINVTVGVDVQQFIYKSVQSPDGGQIDIALRYA